MKDDIRYSEYVFLRSVENRSFDYFNPQDAKQLRVVGFGGETYIQMAITLAEDGHLDFETDEIQLLALRLRGELSPNHPIPFHVHEHHWANPRSALEAALRTNRVHRVTITYRGRRRMEELRDILRFERTLEHFGVLLDMRYFRRDLEDALRRTPDVAVSVIYADMDDFGIINKQFGQDAGDVVMKAYLESVRDGLGLLGTGYRGCGDEIASLVIGQGHERTIVLAESIRAKVEGLRCEHKGIPLPRVTASLGVATTPPEPRTMDVETISENRKRQAKQQGKNRMIAA